MVRTRSLILVSAVAEETARVVAMAPWWQRSYRVPKNSSQLAAIDCLSGVQAEKSEEKLGREAHGAILESLDP